MFLHVSVNMFTGDMMSLPILSHVPSSEYGPRGLHYILPIGTDIWWKPPKRECILVWNVEVGWGGGAFENVTRACIIGFEMASHFDAKQHATQESSIFHQSYHTPPFENKWTPPTESSVSSHSVGWCQQT